MTAPQVPGSPTAAPGEIVAPPVVTTPPAVTPPAGDPENPPWLAARLERERRTHLAELGIADPVKAKALLEAANKAEEDAKSAAEKLGKTGEQLTAAKAEAERYKAVTTEFAARQMLGLTAEQQAAVKAIAGDDAAAQLKAITALTPTWSAQGSITPAGAPAAPAVPAPPAPPASGTAPPPNAPPGSSVSQQSPAEIHAALAKTNPFLAATYALENVREVYPDNK
jgi:hypothetical protein